MTILINGYVGSEVTGIGRSLMEIVSRLPLNQSDQIYITYNYDNSEFKRLASKNIRLIRIPISKYWVFSNLIFNGCIFPFIALLMKVDLIYIPNLIPIIFKFRPMVSVIHDLTEFHVPEKHSWIRTFYRKRSVQIMARRSNQIITVSENTKRDIIERLGIEGSKIVVVYNSSFEYPTNKHVASSEKPFILYIGTIDYPGKGLQHLIGAYEKLRADHSIYPDLIICGMNGKGHEIIDALIDKSKYKKDIQNLGYVNQSKLEELYQNANVFCCLSYYEGFGLPIVEAMEYNTPCLLSNRSCIPEIGGDAALYVDPDDTKEASIKLKSLLLDTSLRETLSAKMKVNLKRFSWSVAAKLTKEVLDKCLAKNG